MAVAESHEIESLRETVQQLSSQASHCQGCKAQLGLFESEHVCDYTLRAGLSSQAGARCPARYRGCGIEVITDWQACTC